MGIIIFLITDCFVFFFYFKKRNPTISVSNIVSSIKIDDSIRKDFLITFISGLFIALITTMAGGLYNKYRDNHPDYKINDSITSWLACELKNGEHCVLFGTDSIYLVPYYTFDIQNNSEKSLYFTDSESVSVNLLEFIPYDELEIVRTSGGADGWINPTEFEINMSTEVGEQYALPYETGVQKPLNGGYISIDSDKMDRFMLKINLLKRAIIDLA